MLKIKRILFLIGIFLICYSILIFMFYAIYLGKFYEIRGFISFLFHLGFALAISASDFIFKSFKKLKLGKEDEIAFRAILFLIIFLNNFVLEMIA